MNTKLFRTLFAAAILAATLAGSADTTDYLTVTHTTGDPTVAVVAGETTFSGASTFNNDVTSTGTIQAEQITSTDDGAIAGLLTVGETLTVGGATTLNNTVETTGTLTIPDGAVGTPALVCSTDADTGVYGSDGNLSVAVGGAQVVNFSAAGAQVTGAVTTTTGATVGTGGSAISAMFIGTGTVASGETAVSVTLTGASASTKCVASIIEDPTNDVAVSFCLATDDACTVTPTGDPGATNADVVVWGFDTP